MTPTLRIDRWLWFARFFKSRSLAAKACTERRVRVNGTVVSKSNHQLRAGDVLTFPQGKEIRVVKVVELGTRRGPAAEAQTLYDDLTERTQPKLKDISQEPVQAVRDRGAGRPTKAERRDTMRLIGRT